MAASALMGNTCAPNSSGAVCQLYRVTAVLLLLLWPLDCLLSPDKPKLSEHAAAVQLLAVAVGKLGTGPYLRPLHLCARVVSA
jgi:hypothetical protein